MRKSLLKIIQPLTKKTKITHLSVHRPLDTEDVYEVLNYCEAESLCNKLEKEWQKELKQANPSILKVFFRIHGVEYCLWGLGGFIVFVCLNGIVQPTVTGKLMTYFEPQQNTTKVQAVAYIMVLLANSVFTAVFDKLYLLSIWMIGLRLEIACTSLIYRKCLKLNLNLNPEYESGKAVTLITKDLVRLGDSTDFGHMLCLAIPHLCILTAVLYRAIGVSALVSVGVVILLFPLNVFFGKLTSTLRLKTSTKTDERIKITQEILTAVRIIKMYTWEKFFLKIVGNLRMKEIINLRWLFYVKYFVSSLGEMSCSFAFYICVVTYVALGNHVTAENAFIVVTSFEGARMILQVFIPLGITQMAELKTALERLTDYLMLSDVKKRESKDFNNKQLGHIYVNNVTVRTAKGVVVLDKLNFEVVNKLSIIMGPTGSGKSTLLKLLLGDVNGDGRLDVCGTISYASQDAWLFPATVRQNILFGEEYEEKRYKRVVEVCALEQDIAMFPNGHETIVTDRGLNLSKGQKARINLARAVYKQADIYLLDDVLSSVDGRVSNQIFKDCIKGFLKYHVCLLVSHQFPPTTEVDNVIVLNKGSIAFSGNYEALKNSDDDYLKQLISNNIASHSNSPILIENAIDDAAENENENEISTLLKASANECIEMYGEAKQTGSVNKKVYYEYLKYSGGFKMLALILFLSISGQVAMSYSSYFVSFWVDVEQNLTEYKLNGTINSTQYIELEKSRSNIIITYSFVILTATVLTLARYFVLMILSSKASIKMHDSVIKTILNSGIAFFDSYLTGNVLNRFSRDLAIVDEQIPWLSMECLRIFLAVLAIFFVVSSVNLYFIIPSLTFIIILYFGRQFYLKTGRSLCRLEGAARSPVVGHLNATMEGLTTIRASNAQKILEKEFDKHQNHYSSVVYMNLSSGVGFTLYLDLSCALYIAIILFSFLFFKDVTQAGKIGVAITQSFSLVTQLQWGIRIMSELETQMTSTERFLEYKNTKQENKAGSREEKWPSRTGAGKTSIVSALFRMYDFEGTIMIDNMDINMVALDYLRSKISIIPQDPVLFLGTVRTNLDPDSEYSDNVLWEALDKVEMKHTIQSLDKKIYEGGFDFSVGERQLICLARAVVRKNNILILDEATANIDSQTDHIIQNVIKENFSDRTVITIAHKLDTILDSDNIVVMDCGRVDQYGPPKVLLEDTRGLFYSMVKGSGLL
ncbi:hypothetical protein FQA39_LY10113 [Lamprigera yunnana]|nr:hypothetical protein FQA39_LY10113 [Lamprigera yunnana]